MTVLNFPPTLGEATDGSFTYEENGVTYSWDGVKWVALIDPADDPFYEYPGSSYPQTYQKRFEQYVSVKDFGAVGDGVADDTAAWVKAIESGVEVLYVPPGSYNVDGLPTVTGRNFALIGESSRSTKLNCSNTTGNGFAVSIDEGGQAEYAAIIKGITIFSNRNVQAENALYIISDDPVGEIYKQTIIEDVRIQGPWRNGIILDSVRIAKVHNVNFNGRSDFSQVGIFIKGLCMDSVISNYVAANALQGVGAAIYVDGDVEGIHLTESTIINCLTGVQANAPDYEPSLFISDTHMNTRKYAIAIDNFGQLNIHDNLFYAYTSTDPSQIVDYSGIIIQGGNGQVDSSITDNIFHGFGRDANPSANTNGILWNSAFSGTLNDNLFIGLDRGIVIDSSTATVISEGNTFREVTQPHDVLQGNITSVTTVDSEHTIEHKGDADKETALKLVSQGNSFRMRMRADAGAAINFPANLQFFANNTEGLRIQPDATTWFKKEVFISNNGLRYPGNDNTEGGLHAETTADGTSLFISRKDAPVLRLNRNNTDGNVISLRKDGGEKGSIQITDANIQIKGLAGGPLIRNGFDLDGSSGLIDAVKNVVDRINALESNEVIDDATDTSLLQLIASATARLDSIEARLTALEGGN